MADWTKEIAVADLPATFTDPTDTTTRGEAAEYLQALSPGGQVDVTMDGGATDTLTLSAGQTIRGAFVAVTDSDCDLICGTGPAPVLAGGAAGSTGPTGPTGPTGATGATGAAGSATAYTPAVPGNWSPVPTTVGGAMDQLVARVVVLETP